MEDERFPKCSSQCSYHFGHEGEHSRCPHFRLGCTNTCIRHELSCLDLFGICGDECPCRDEAWEPDFDES